MPAQVRDVTGQLCQTFTNKLGVLARAVRSGRHGGLVDVQAQDGAVFKAVFYGCSKRDVVVDPEITLEPDNLHG